MNLEPVKDEILGSAQEQAKQILSEARKEANHILKETEKKVQEMQESSDAAAKKAIDIIKRQELASAELENKKMLLETKKQAIDMAFEEARKKIEGMDDRKKESLLKKLLEKASKDIEVAFAYCSKKDAKLLKGINPETMEMLGGLVAENRERTIRVDYSFDSLLQGIKENEMQSLNNILFG